MSAFNNFFFRAACFLTGHSYEVARFTHAKTRNIINKKAGLYLILPGIILPAVAAMVLSMIFNVDFTWGQAFFYVIWAMLYLSLDRAFAGIGGALRYVIAGVFALFFGLGFHIIVERESIENHLGNERRAQEDKIDQRFAPKKKQHKAEKRELEEQIEEKRKELVENLRKKLDKELGGERGTGRGIGPRARNIKEQIDKNEKRLARFEARKRSEMERIDSAIADLEKREETELARIGNEGYSLHKLLEGLWVLLKDASWFIWFFSLVVFALALCLEMMPFWIAKSYREDLEEYYYLERRKSYSELSKESLPAYLRYDKQKRENEELEAKRKYERKNQKLEEQRARQQRKHEKKMAKMASQKSSFQRAIGRPFSQGRKMNGSAKSKQTR